MDGLSEEELNRSSRNKADDKNAFSNGTLDSKLKFLDYLENEKNESEEIEEDKNHNENKNFKRKVPDSKAKSKNENSPLNNSTEPKLSNRNSREALREKDNYASMHEEVTSNASSEEAEDQEVVEQGLKHASEEVFIDDLLSLDVLRKLAESQNDNYGEFKCSYQADLLKRVHKIEDFDKLNSPIFQDQNRLSKLPNSDIERNLKFGDMITLSILPKREECKASKMSCLLNISDRCWMREMQADEFDTHCRFRILPATDYFMQQKLLQMIDQESIERNHEEGKNYENDYYNFVIEGKRNIEKYQRLGGQNIRYGDMFQLYQESTRRYLCLKECNPFTLEEFGLERIDGDVYACCFSETPNEWTHFSFEASDDYQREDDENIIKNYHELYLQSCADKRLYFKEKLQYCWFMEVSKTTLN